MNQHSSVAVVDVSTPSSPSLRAKKELSTVLHPATAVVNNGVKACVATDGVGEVRILDVSQSSNPSQIGLIQNLGAVASLAMTQDGQSLYVGNYAPERCLRIFNIGNPASPTLVSSNYIGDEILGIALASSNAYLAAESTGVIVVAVGNQAAPVVSRSYDTPGYAQQVAVSGDLLYVADNTAGLVILKLSDAELPEVVITNPTFCQFTQIQALQ